MILMYDEKVHTVVWTQSNVDKARAIFFHDMLQEIKSKDREKFIVNEL